MRILFLVAALNVALSIALGAFGAHALEDQLSAASMTTYGTASLYHQIQGLGVLISLLLTTQVANEKRARIGSWLLLAGCVIFSGSLYALAMSGMRWLGAITPIGGVCFIVGWILIGLSGWKERVS